ncbi:MAG: OsmC family protein [Myxococcales bacterium]|nr:OsmC family protein [Myxococcales bacterium]
MKSTLEWTGGMAFDVELDGHTFAIDADPQFGGVNKGPKPKGLALSSLAGCTAMDVASILHKMRHDPTRMTVSAEAELTEKHPKVFADPITVVFTVEGDVPPDKLWRAVRLSRDQYCGVSAMLRKHVPIVFRVFLNGEELPEPAE